MNHADFLPPFRREGRGLPFGRRQRGVGIGDRLQDMRLAGGHGDLRHQARLGEFGVEPGVAAGRGIEELRIGQVPGVRPDIAQEQRLAPAAMAEDHVGDKAGSGRHLVRRPRRDQAAARHFGIDTARAFDGGVGRVAVAEDGHRGLAGVALRRQRARLMPTRGKRRCQMQKLARKILVNEKDLHSAASSSRKAAAINSRV